MDWELEKLSDVQRDNLRMSLLKITSQMRGLEPQWMKDLQGALKAEIYKAHEAAARHRQSVDPYAYDEVLDDYSND